MRKLSDVVSLLLLLVFEGEFLEHLREDFLLVDLEVEAELLEKLFVVIRLLVLYFREELEDEVCSPQDTVRH